MRKNPFASRSFHQCFVAMNQIDLSGRNAVVTGWWCKRADSTQTLPDA